MSLPKYAEYKETESPWQLEAPSHWSGSRVRFVAGLNPSKREVAVLDRDTEVSFLPMDAIGDDGSIRLDETRLLSQVENGYTYFRDDDVVIAKITPCFENGKGAVIRGLLGGVGFGTTELIVVRPRPAKTTSEYLGWLFASPTFRNVAEGAMYGAGGQKRVPDDFVRDFSMAFPPIEEQSVIAAFLNRETGKIDALIDEQGKLLTLLAEKRQATISHAVTRGLNPNAPMKESGVPWLGQVPAHWDVVPLMYLTEPNRPIMYGIVLPGPDVEEGIPIVKGGDVRLHKLKVDLLNRTTVEIEAPFARARLRPMDIVYSIRGTIGDAEVVPDELLDANITQDVARISPRSGIQTGWLLYAMKSKPVFVQLEQRSLGAAVRGINIFELKRAKIPVPPSVERDAIATFLKEEAEKLDGLRYGVEHAIALLKERRSALIAAAVTGKIDVRRAA
ncbi:restriction endonuclease subunit S [Rhodanobacter thiooxydans]|nr:restriction endonuclease subunit S [Rhodanobacter thiooxydans]MCW0203782.1 restriction endonuclease subunit S [Rhodanobacter thiooxydans]